jgi:NAD(P)-dependent dehydrogenase (short-subunit alcohol dehydrogenase family)
VTVALVTGATSGIGKATALGLAKKGMRVVLLCRDGARGEAARAEIATAAPGASTELLVADLSSQRQIRRASEELHARFPSLDVLVNNAGVFHRERTVTEDGVEATFAVNHLAYFLLTNLLLDLVRGRIVVVASEAHRGAKLRFDDLQLAKKYDGWKAYGKSKLANLLFTFELARRLEGTGVTVNALHPGVVATGIVREIPLPVRALWNVAFKSPEKGAKTSLFLASSPAVEGISGRYFVDEKEKEPSAEARDAAAAKRLWEASEKLTAP